jgi:DNA polymerase-3 subunit epsilon
MKILYLDVETTGVDTAKDDVVELAIITDHADRGGATRLEHAISGYTRRYKPTVPIPASAVAIHGISDALVADLLPFSHCVVEVAKILATADVVVGYNLDFDLQMLQGEFKRAHEPWPFKPGVIVVDLWKLWKQLEPRNLQSAHRKFCGGGDFTGQHAASDDALATRRVLVGMLSMHDLMDKPWEHLAQIAEPKTSSRFGPSDHLQWVNDRLVLTFGKHAGEPLIELATRKPDYLRWMGGLGYKTDGTRVTSTFPAHVVEACERALGVHLVGPDRHQPWDEPSFNAWARAVR